MKKNVITKLVISIFIWMLASASQARIPLWTFTPVPGYPSSITLSSQASATIQYLVTNQSQRPQILEMRPIQGIIASGCALPLGYHQSCTLNLTVDGRVLKGDILGGPVLCDKGNPNQCYQPAPANILAIRLNRSPIDSAILTPNVSALRLSINCLPSSSCTTMQNPALTGNPREIIIQNTGSRPARNLSVTPSGLPSNTSITSNSCTGTLDAGDSCSITLTPGNEASSDASNTPCTAGTLPVASTITITADNTPATEVNAYVLSYGCIYQGGFIYSIDDTTNNGQTGTCTSIPCQGNIGGKIAAISDTFPGQNPTMTGDPNWGGVGIDVGASTYETNPSGANDGSANTATIISALNLDCSTNTTVAACLCNQLSVNNAGSFNCTGSSCYTGWYLPASCELGIFLNCTAGSTNYQEQLVENSLIPSATLGFVDNSLYWSSTQYSPQPQEYPWAEFFSTSGSNPTSFNKRYPLGIRCSRVLTF